MYDNITPWVQWTPGVRHKVKDRTIIYLYSPQKQKNEQNNSK